jgi:transposase InsO family protein
MPWHQESVMSQRFNFVRLVEISHVMSEVCRRFGISRKTGYKWLHRFQGAGLQGLEDWGRRPHRSPGKTPEEMEELILLAREAHPAWGGRKLKRWLESQGAQGLPVPSTITEILRRHGLILPEESQKRGPFQRFEYARPNDLWQMDFKGYFRVAARPCYPLTVLDDHSRFSVVLKACEDQRRLTVKHHLTEAFETYGLPAAMLVDNGGPWASASGAGWTKLSVWLLRVGVDVIHSRVRHPQTLGKDERFHKTLSLECVEGHTYSTFNQVQNRFDKWRDIYNYERPHESVGMEPPAARYKISSRAFPATLPVIECGPDDKVRKVSEKGEIKFCGRFWRVGKAFYGYPVGVRPSEEDGLFQIYFCQRMIREIDLRSL